MVKITLCENLIDEDLKIEGHPGEAYHFLTSSTQEENKSRTLHGYVISRIVDIKHDVPFGRFGPIRNRISSRCVFLEGKWMIDLDCFNHYVDENLRIGDIVYAEIYLAGSLREGWITVSSPQFGGYVGDFHKIKASGKADIKAFPDRDMDPVLLKNQKARQTQANEAKVMQGLDKAQSFLSKMKDFLEDISDIFGG